MEACLYWGVSWYWYWLLAWPSPYCWYCSAWICCGDTCTYGLWPSTAYCVFSRTQLAPNLMLWVRAPVVKPMYLTEGRAVVEVSVHFTRAKSGLKGAPFRPTLK